MAVTKIGAAKSAASAVKYVLKEEENSALKQPKIIGGSVTTWGAAADVIKDFEMYSELKPNYKNQVLHLTVSLKPGEHLEEEKKVEFSEKLLDELNFQAEKIPYLIVEHHDKDYEHWHIVAGRIRDDGSVVNDSFLAVKAIEKTKELEREFGLAEVEYTPSNDRRTKRNEYKMMQRTGELSVIAEAKMIIDESLEKKAKTYEFVAALQERGFDVLPNVSETTGRMNGFSFSKDEIKFKSSAIGRNYSFQNLQKRGLDYDPARDTIFLLKVKNESTAQSSSESGRNRTTETAEQATEIAEQAANLSKSIINRAESTSPERFEQFQEDDTQRYFEIQCQKPINNDFNNLDRYILAQTSDTYICTEVFATELYNDQRDGAEGIQRNNTEEFSSVARVLETAELTIQIFEPKLRAAEELPFEQSENKFNTPKTLAEMTVAEANEIANRVQDYYLNDDRYTSIYLSDRENSSSLTNLSSLKSSINTLDRDASDIDTETRTDKNAKESAKATAAEVAAAAAAKADEEAEEIFEMHL